jgi:hypothetical protein
VITCLEIFYGFSINSQNQIWSIGNQQWNGVDPNPSPLPTVPNSNLDYSGQQAQYAANAWHNPIDGSLLFFVVDGVVYNLSGILIQSIAFAPNNLTLEVSTKDWDHGFYLIEVIENGLNIGTKRVLVK